MGFDLKTMCLDIFDTLTDCRDLSVVVTFRHQASLQEWKKMSLAADKRKFKIRAIILSLVIGSVLLTEELAPGNEVTERIASFENTVHLLQTELKDGYRQIHFDQVNDDSLRLHLTLILRR